MPEQMSLRLSYKGGRSRSSEGKETMNALSWGREQVDLGWARVSRMGWAQLSHSWKWDLGLRKNALKGETRTGRDTAHRGLGRNENRTQRGRGLRRQGPTECWKLVSCKAVKQTFSKQEGSGQACRPHHHPLRSIWKLEGAEQRASWAEGICLRDSQSGRMGVALLGGS